MMRTRACAGLALSAALALGACSGFRTADEMARVEAMTPSGDAFQAALYREYLGLADGERAESDWRDVAYFLAKAERAARGEAVEPQPVAERDLDADAAEALAAARERLLALFGRRGVLGRAPAEAAAAQGAYECWMQEQEEGHQIDEIDACRQRLDASIAAAEAKLVGRSLLVVLPNPDGTYGAVTFDDGRGVSVLDAVQAALRFDPDVDTLRARVAADEVSSTFGRAIDAQPIPPRSFTLYFEKGKDRLTPETASGAFAELIADARQRGGPEVFLTGHADRVGSERFNDRLSAKRVAAVVEGLVAVGVDEAAIVVESRGERDPAVPTLDETAEPLNRRVEVFIR